MKKVLMLLIVIVTLFTASCGHKSLDKPANVKIDETGLISWDKVEDATSYKIIINGREYVSYLNLFQVPDITNDFTFYVISVNDKGVSEPTVPISVEGVKKPITSMLPGELASDIIRKTKVNAQCYNEIEAAISVGVSKALELGLNESQFMVFKGSMESTFGDLKNFDSSKILPLYSAVSNVTKEVNRTYLMVYVYYFQGLLIAYSHQNDDQIATLTDSLASASAADKININHQIEAYQGINNCYREFKEVIKKQDTTIVDYLNDCLYPTLNMMKKALSEETVSAIESIIKSEDKVKMVDEIINIKNNVIGALKEEPIPYKSIEGLLDILYESRDTITVYLTYKGIVDNADYSGAIKFIEDLQNDNATLAKDILAKYNNVIDVIYNLDGATLKEALKYDDPIQVIGYLGITVLTRIDFTYTVKVEDLRAIVNSIATEKQIEDATGLTHDDLTKIYTFLAKYLNKDNKAFITANIDTIVSCLGIKLEQASTEPMTITDKKINGFGSEFYEGKKYFERVVYTPTKHGFTYTVDQYNIISIDKDKNITYTITTVTGKVEGLNSLPGLILAILEENKASKQEIVSDILALSDVISKIKALPQDVQKVLDTIKDLTGADISSLTDDAYKFIVDFVTYTRDHVDLNKLVLSYTINDDELKAYQTSAYDGFKTEAIKQNLYVLVDKTATILEQKGLLVKLGFSTKDEFIAKYKKLIDDNFTKAPQA